MDSAPMTETRLHPTLSTATATYRLQLRGGVTFDAAAEWIPYLAGLGVSHLYLSPPFTATEGSTHGYDVTCPDALDPVLGGPAGFERLAAAARRAGIGIILDIVPNHTAFSTANPWLRDVLRHGRDSRYARHFDIDWARPLMLPWLGKPLPEVLASAPAEIAEEPDGPVLRLAGLSLPLAPGAVAGPLDRAGLAALLDGQAWRLAHWRLERDSITHRRFFSVTGLIGMRVEDPDVFEDMHRLIFDLVDTGAVAGLRIDHIDGLADPAGYLQRLAARLPGCPLWVEKILSGDEPLDPDWPVAGTTGYEAGRLIARLLSDPDGVARLEHAWAGATGRTGSFHDALTTAKPQVLAGELAAELHQLVELGGRALAAAGIEAGPEMRREALAALLVAMPRYRTYFTDRASMADLALWDEVRIGAGAGLPWSGTLDALAGIIAAGKGPEAMALRVRFQQVSGALIAKSLEDTAGFRHTPYLAANEVGAEPDEPVATAAEAMAFATDRLALWPGALTLTSSHDTKRSEDARMRLVAISHAPEAFLHLFHAVAALAGEKVTPGTLWYLVQSAIAIWEPGRADTGDRLAAHMEKAMREAKEVTFWTDPRKALELPALTLARQLMAIWRDNPPLPLLALATRAEVLSLCQLALKVALPGIPDIYRGTEGAAMGLTDPDNRLPVDRDRMAALGETEGFAGAKARLLHQLLELRRRAPGLFLTGSVELDGGLDGLRLTRRAQSGEQMTLLLRPKSSRLAEAVTVAPYRAI